MLYDLFPDAIEIAGAIESGGRWSRIIGGITKRNQSKCEASVYLGNFLKEHAELRWGKAKCSKVIDISTDLSQYNSIHNSLRDTQKIIVHYGGQLGHLHDATSIIEALKFVSTSDLKDKIEFNFYVSGAQAGFLEESLKGFPIKIISAVPSHRWREDIQNFHIGLVSLSPGGASVCLPSKTYGMMAGGMAILAICPKWSDLAKLIDEVNGGWVINNSVFREKDELKDGKYLSNLSNRQSTGVIVNEFYDTLKAIVDDREMLEQKRHNAFSGVRNNYNIGKLSEKWIDVLETIKNG